MPRAKPFDKKTATTYTLVHRPQNDPLIHDSDAPSQILAELPSSSKQPRKSKIKQRGDLDAEFGLAGVVRDNEGEAAEHGIYYDDTSYDYMQHMRDLGGSTEATWIEATAEAPSKGKAKQSLDDALRQLDLHGDNDDAQSVGGYSLASSSRVPFSARQQTYQDQQDVPDVLAGFQPDMDPRLREVLEALDDDEYVDDDEDMYAALAGEGGEVFDQDEWEASLYQDNDDDDGWESDDTTKPHNEYPDPEPHSSINAIPATISSTQPTLQTAEEDGAWLASFAKSKVAPSSSTAVPVPPQQHAPQRPSDLVSTSSAAYSSASQLPRRKKRKGALSSSTGFSMTSSALARTEPLSTLDARFDRIAESYLEDGDDDDIFDDGASLASGASRASGLSRASAFSGSHASEAPSLVPARLEAVLDEYLGGDSGKGRGRAMKKAGRQGRWGQQSGMEQLDEIRKGLGPARLADGSKTEAQKV